MEKGVNVFIQDVKEQTEFTFVGDITNVSPSVEAFFFSSVFFQFFLIGELDSPAVANIDLARRAPANKMKKRFASLTKIPNVKLLLPHLPFQTARMRRYLLLHVSPSVLTFSFLSLVCT
jgi:hypothetical protein